MVDTFNVDGDTTLEIDLYGGGGADIYNIGYVLYGDIFGEAGLNVIIMSYTHDAANQASLASNPANAGIPLDTVSLGRVGGMLGGVMTGGIVDGGADGATLSYAGYTGTDDPVSVALTGMGGTVGFTGTATGISGTFDDILTVTGGSGTTDTLTGINAAATFTVDGTNEYVSTRTLAFADFEQLTGGSAVDTFTISNAHTGNLSGGGGDDVFTIDAVLTGMISGGADDDTVTVNAGGTVTMGIDTGDDDDTVTINDGMIANGGIILGDGDDTVTLTSSGGDEPSVTGGITGGAGTDTFIISGGRVSGTVDGGGQDDHLNMAGLSEALIIALSGTPDGGGFGGTVTGGGLGASLVFDGINEITGGTTMTDTLQGLNAGGTFTLGAARHLRQQWSDPGVQRRGKFNRRQRHRYL